MSKLLKVIVNTLLLLAILSAGALVIPPFAGITTLVSDGMEIPTFPAALSRTQRRQIRHRLRREKKSWLMTIPESISIRYSPSTPLPEPHP